MPNSTLLDTPTVWIKVWGLALVRVSRVTADNGQLLLNQAWGRLILRPPEQLKHQLFQQLHLQRHLLLLLQAQQLVPLLQLAQQWVA
jgi:hypothetical protein